MSWSDWLWGSSKANGSSSVGAQDPVRSLDPSLRKYLEKETPKPISRPSQQETERPSYTDQLTGATQRRARPVTSQPNEATDIDQPIVPSESLYQDGRYAHLWQNYRPQGEIENAHKSPQEKLQDIVDTYKTRKAAVQRAALENCAVENIAITDCYLHGSWADRSTMCRTQNRALERCFTMQAKFLKSLGYLSLERSEEDEERIQMHADTLYHRMLDEEKREEELQKQGKLVEDVLSAESRGKVEETQEVLRSGGFADALKVRMKAVGMMGQTQVGTKEDGKPLTFQDLSPEKQAVFLQRLKNQTPAERALSVRAVSGELASNEDYLKKLVPVWEEDKRQREQRRAEGKETIGDRIKSAWGWDGPRKS